VGLIVLPVAFALRAGGTVIVVAGGAATWFASVELKGLAARWPNRTVVDRPMPVVAALNGVWSAVTELGFAGMGLATLNVDSLPAVLAFGIGAASAEVVYVLVKGIRSPGGARVVEEWERGARVSLCVRYSVPLERLVAGVGHVSSRGLVFTSLKLPISGGILTAVAALFFFSITDGIAYYGHLAGWNWNDPNVCRTFHSALAMLAAVEFCVFLAVLRSVNFV
jgi:hypothetical protein